MVETFIANGEADESLHATLLPLFIKMCPNYDTINEDDLENGEADRNVHNISLPPNSYSSQDMFYNVDRIDE